MQSRFLLLTFEASHIPDVQGDPFLRLSALVEVGEEVKGRASTAAFDVAERAIRERYKLGGPGFQIPSRRTEEVANVFGLEGLQPIAREDGCTVWRINELHP